MANLFKDKRSKTIISTILIVGILVCLIVPFFVLAEDPPPEEQPIIWKRTATQNIYKNPDNSYTTTIGQGVINIDDKTRRFPNYVPWNSSFFPIINSTYKDYEYQLDTYYSNYEAYFQDDIKAGKGFRFEVNDYWFTYDLSGGKMQWAVENKSTPDWGKTKSIGSVLSSNPSTYDNTVRYNNSFLNTDVRYMMRLDGVKENFVLSSLPSDPGAFLYLEYTGELQFDNNLTIWANGEIQTSKEFITSGAVLFKDENNQTIFKMPSPIAEDSNGNIINLVYDIKPNAEKLAFGLKVPTDFLETAIYPVMIDPTITLTGTTNIIDLHCTETGFCEDNHGNGLAVGESGDYDYYSYIKFSLSDLIFPIYNITNASFSFTTSKSNWDEAYNLHIYEVSNQSWDANSVTTFSSKPQNGSLLKIFTNDTISSNTDYFGRLNFTVRDWIINQTDNLENGNLSFMMKVAEDLNRGILAINWIRSSELASYYQPQLIVDYTPYIDIISPTPSQIFTNDQPTTYFNVSTAVAMTECYWSPDSGTTNYTMNANASSTGFTLSNTTMVDGAHTIKYYCNQSDDGTWRTSDTVSFDVDSVNVTVCRDLTVSRTYYLQKNIIDNSLTSNCIEIENDNLIFDGNGYYISSDDPYSGIRINVQDYVLIKDVNISMHPTSSIGIYFLNSNYSNVTNSRIISNNVGIHLQESSNNNFIGVIINDSNNDDINVNFLYNSIDNVALNCSYNLSKETIYSGSDLTRKWYFSTQVNDSAGNPLQSAQVNIYDKDNNLLISELTDPNGRIPQQEIIEYVNNGGTKSYQTPHTINISKADYITNTTTYNLTTDTNVYHQVILGLSNVAPATILKTPTDNSWSDSLLNTMVCNSTDSNGNLKNVTIYTWIGGSEETNNTKTITGSSNSSTWTNLGFTSQGNYEWNCYTCDDSNTCAFAPSNYTLKIDSVDPLISIIYPTNTNYTSIQTALNYSQTDTNTDSCWYSLDGGANNSSRQDCGTNWTGLDSGQGSSTWTVYCNDSATNVGSDSVTFFVDSIYPNLDLLTPINNTFTQLTSLEINLTITDTNFQNVTFYLTGADTNTTTLNTNSNFTFVNLAEGEYYWRVEVRDLLNHLNTSETRTYTVDSNAPTVILNTPENYTNTTTTSQNLTANLTDTIGIKNTTLYVHNSSGDNILTSTTNYIEGITEAFIGIIHVFSDGIYEWFYNVFDWAGQSATSGNHTITVDTTAPPVNIVFPVDTASYNYQNFTINYTVSDATIGVDSVWFTNDSGVTNYTITGNFSANLTDGTFTYIIYSNDTLGNENSDSVTFTVSTLSPAITLNYPPDFTWFNSGADIYFNFTVTDADNLDTCELWTNYTYLCPQEFANVSTTCGGLSTGNYRFDNFTNWTNPNNVIDGDWSTYAEVDETTKKYLYMNYTKPVNATGAILEIKDGQTMTYPNDVEGNQVHSLCFAQDVLQLRLEFSHNSGSVSSANWNCWSGSEWTIVENNAMGTQHKVYEERILWIMNATYRNQFTWIAPTSGQMNFTVQNLSYYNTYDNIYYFEGQAIWNIWCNDTLNNPSWASTNFTLGIDATSPVITFDTGTESDYSNLSQNFIYTNVTFTEDNFQNITFNLYNDSGNVNSTVFTIETYNINWTGLDDNNYTYEVNITDKANNKGSTGIRHITIDDTNPSATLTSPKDNLYNNTDVNFTSALTDNLGIKNATLYIYNQTDLVNQTTTSFVADVTSRALGVIVTLIDGIYEWFYNVFDWAGNSDTTGNRTLIIDKTYPNTTTSHYNPTTIYTETDVIIYGNVSDTYLDTVWIEINHSGNYQNTTVTTYSGSQYYYDLSNSDIDNFENVSWRWWANDSANNQNYSTLMSFNVLNRNPYNVTIITPENETYVNSASIIINFTATDTDSDTLNYSFYNSTDGITFSIYNSSTLGWVNFTGFDTTEDITHYYYITANDTILQNTSETRAFFIDGLNPNLTIDNPKRSPIIQCSLININLNYTVQDTNIDYCEFNVTGSGLLTTPNTRIEDCSNVTFNNSMDNAVQQLFFRVVDKAGNSNMTTDYLIYMKTGDSSCPQPSVTPGGGGGLVVGEEINKTELYCGDGIYSPERGETFYNCPEDYPGFGISSNVLLMIFGVITVVLIGTSLFERTKQYRKFKFIKTKNILSKRKWKKKFGG